MFGLEFGWEVGVAFLAVLVLMALPHVVRKMHGPVDYIQPHELSQMLKSGESLRLLDIRTQKEYASDHIAEAIHLSTDKIADYLVQTKRDEAEPTPTILVCQSDLISIRMASRLRKNGIAKVKVMQGGMLRRQRSRLPLQRS